MRSHQAIWMYFQLKMDNSEGLTVQHRGSSYYYYTMYLRPIMGIDIECSYFLYQAISYLKQQIS